MSMGKDRLRSVKWSNRRSSPHHPVLTTARVGPYGYIHTIYIRPYGTRDTTLAPWISKATGSQAHQTHRLTYPQTHQPPESQVPEPQVPESLGHQSHQPPSPPWCLGHRATIPMSHRATRLLAHQTHRCQGALTHRSHHLPSHQVIGSQIHQPPKPQTHRCYSHQTMGV